MLCVFEDSSVSLLEPLTLTRPAFDLWCGASSLLDKQCRAVRAEEVGLLVRPVLADLCRLNHPNLAVNDDVWLRRGGIVFVNARWLPSTEVVEVLQSPRVGLVDDEVAFVVSPSPVNGEYCAGSIDSWIESCKQTLPRCQAGGTMIGYPWDLVENNEPALCRDAETFKHGVGLPSVAVLGPEDQLLTHAEATIEPFVTVDTSHGPVMIDRGAVVHSFSRLEGPCYVGQESIVFGAKLRGGAIGPCCRIGGEVEASVIQGFSNKYHDGFLGHSYVGEWVNLGAGTQVSDLRNDYGQIRVVIKGERVSTGLTKVGVFIGDHTKTGLGTLLNSGTMIGAFGNLLPSGSFLPSVIPSFCQVKNGQITERRDLRQAFATADTVLKRRGRELTGTHVELFFSLYDTTAGERQRVIRESDMRRWRKSV